MKNRIRVYYDSKVAVFDVVPDRDSIKHLGEDTVLKILKNGIIESVQIANSKHHNVQNKDKTVECNV